ncbi:MAG: hypothetical protein HY918_02965 [Candidatus Doudnabacteria bacterium]|nr:hypothetical protein [Candidatus Doudnabacteria bacterium]
MIFYFIIILAVASRFVPHMPNVGLITALAMFSAANMDWKKSVGITLAARFISDIFLGFFAWPLMVAVYAAHLVGILFGVWIKNSTSPALRASSPHKGRDGERMQYRWVKIIFSSLASSAIFFLVTNFAFLYAEYPHNFAGVMLAYANGLPFLRGTMAGDIAYSLLLFGSFELAMHFKSKTSETKFLIPNS